jgi:hypothetical protein
MKKLSTWVASGLVVFGAHAALAAVTPDQAALLKTTLTPMGSERAGSADGLIPPWTGGLTTMPAGLTPHDLMPDFFASDPKVVTIDASNMAQYKDRLTDGVMAMMTKYPGFHIDVYPTHRTQALPQWVYDDTYQNALNAKPLPQGARLGFTGAYGGYPFPIPDADPDLAGAEIMWNHNCRWVGSADDRIIASYVMSHGVLTLASGYQVYQDSPYYQQNGSLATYSGWIRRFGINYLAPPEINGQQLIEWQPTNALFSPTQVWSYLNGQGRVRKAPEETYDDPSSAADDVANEDEYFVFYGAQDRYDWKLIGKKEMYIPYNNNKLAFVTADQAQLPNYINPDDVRWELHRVWVVDATLHPGDRNVVPHRRYYIDEDTWNATIGDEWDAQGNIWKVDMMFTQDLPYMPGTIYMNSVTYNLQANEYVTLGGPWANPPYNDAYLPDQAPQQTWNPQTLGAQAQY